MLLKMSTKPSLVTIHHLCMSRKLSLGFQLGLVLGSARIILRKQASTFLCLEENLKVKAEVSELFEVSSILLFKVFQAFLLLHCGISLIFKFWVTSLKPVHFYHSEKLHYHIKEMEVSIDVIIFTFVKVVQYIY